MVSTEGGYSPIYNPFCLLGVLEGLAGQSAGIADPWHDDATVVAARAAADDRVRAAIAAVRERPAALVHVTRETSIRLGSRSLSVLGCEAGWIGHLDRPLLRCADPEGVAEWVA